MPSRDQTLYRFLPQRWAVRAIVEERLRIGRLSALNDPFEGLLGAAWSPLLEQHPTLENAPGQFAQFLRNGADRKYGVIAFSRNLLVNGAELMWSHYSEGHKGIALGFSRQRIHDLGLLFNVDYYPRRPTFSPSSLGENLLNGISHLKAGLPNHESSKASSRTFRRVFGRKAPVWKYESEVRLVVELPGGRERHQFMPYPREALVSVVIGATSRLSVQQVRKLLAGHDWPAVRVEKLRLDKEHYALERDL